LSVATLLAWEENTFWLSLFMCKVDEGKHLGKALKRAPTVTSLGCSQCAQPCLQRQQGWRESSGIRQPGLLVLGKVLHS
jgi:hypothetical protein